MAWIVPVVTVLAAGASAYSSIQQSKAAKKAANANAKSIEMETGESARRSQESLAQRLGASRARIGASGIQMTGSPASYIGEMQAEGTRQINWMKEAGRTRADAQRVAGEMESSATLWGGLGQAGVTAAQGFGKFFRQRSGGSVS